jgi:hypothetical protein
MNSSSLKKIIFFVAGFAVVIVVSAFLVNKNLQNPKFFGPSIMFAEEKKDLGNVKQGSVIEGYFEFVNKGKMVLTIKNVSTSCGCTGAMVDEKRDFQPGETGKIKYTFNTEGRSGKNEKSITIESNDPVNPRKTVSFSCNILNP